MILKGFLKKNYKNTRLPVFTENRVFFLTRKLFNLLFFQFFTLLEARIYAN